MIPVRVVYRACIVNDERGFSYQVLAARGELRHLGEGWSKGAKRNAIESFRQHAKSAGWCEREERAERMRGAA